MSEARPRPTRRANGGTFTSPLSSACSRAGLFTPVPAQGKMSSEHSRLLTPVKMSQFIQELAETVLHFLVVL